MLWAAAMEKGYSYPLWLTYKQAAELGGQVRKGEKASLIVYADTFTKEGPDEQRRSRGNRNSVYERLHGFQCRAG
jgi:antirestriction protein ArdC